MLLAPVGSEDLDAWQTDAPGPFVTIRAGGPLEGVVTLTAIAEGRQLAKKHRVLLTIHRRDGSVLRTQTYEPSPLV